MVKKILFAVLACLVLSGCEAWRWGGLVQPVEWNVGDHYEKLGITNESLDRWREYDQTRKINLLPYYAPQWNELQRKSYKEGESTLKLRSSMQLDIKVHASADRVEYEGTITITPDGFFDLPNTSPEGGRIFCDGMTIDELKSELERRFKHTIKSPRVTINITKNLGVEQSEDINIGRIMVMGALGGQKLGAQELSIRGDEKLSNLIAKIGGLDTLANQRQIHICRRSGKGQDAVTTLIFCDWEQFFYYKDWEQDVKLEPNDIIVIPAKEPYFHEQFKKEFDYLAGYAGGILSWDFLVQQLESRFFAG